VRIHLDHHAHHSLSTRIEEGQEAAEPMRNRSKIAIVVLALSFLLAPAGAWAAITATDLTRGGSSSSSSSYTTASITPSANRLVLAWVTNDRWSSPDIPTLSGNGLTWVQVNTVEWDSTFSPGKGSP
jgi:hypothetical protein